jgi:hypothetical protein
MVKINVSIFAFFSANWSDYSSKLQMRSIGLKTPFPTFSFFSPTPQNMFSRNMVSLMLFLWRYYTLLI